VTAFSPVVRLVEGLLAVDNRLAGEALAKEAPRGVVLAV